MGTKINFFINSYFFYSIIYPSNLFFSNEQTTTNRIEKNIFCIILLTIEKLKLVEHF